MIDKDGKVGGKINLIDLIIILVIVAAGVFLFYRSTRTVEKTSEAVPVKLTLFAENTFEHVLDQVKEGDPVWDYSSNIELGTLESYTYHPFTGLIADGTGGLVDVPVEGKYQANLVINAEGVISPHGVTIDGQLYGIGHTLVMYAGNCKFFISVSDIEPIEYE